MPRNNSFAVILAILFLGLTAGDAFFARAIPKSLDDVRAECAQGECISACKLKADLSLGILPKTRSTLFMQETTLVSYKVEGDTISEPTYSEVSADLVSFQHDTQAHERIWEFFTRVIPADQRAELREFSIISGGHVIAAYDINRATDNWSLYVNVLDAQNPETLTEALVHEFGHRVTLNAAQQAHLSKNMKCPQEQLYGCPRADSYLNLFYEKYWKKIYPEWLEQHTRGSDSGQMDFYAKYASQFVTPYASSSPIEDIAETWTYFVLSPKPEATTIANRKILFFYDIPELVELRYKIISGICSY